MAYIIVVNPAILSFAGIPVGPSTVATILAAVFGTLLMGLYANRPIAVAPYMGENAFVAFGLAAIGATWPQMLGAVFVSGLVFLAITVLGVRAWLAEAVSPSLKHAFAVGHRPLPGAHRPLRDRDRHERRRRDAAASARGARRPAARARRAAEDRRPARPAGSPGRLRLPAHRDPAAAEGAGRPARRHRGDGGRRGRGRLRGGPEGDRRRPLHRRPEPRARCS